MDRQLKKKLEVNFPLLHWNRPFYRKLKPIKTSDIRIKYFVSQIRLILNFYLSWEEEYNKAYLYPTNIGSLYLQNEFQSNIKKMYPQQ